jgi:hypothetical protein
MVAAMPNSRVRPSARAESNPLLESSGGGEVASKGPKKWYAPPAHATQCACTLHAIACLLFPLTIVDCSFVWQVCAAPRLRERDAHPHSDYGHRQPRLTQRTPLPRHGVPSSHHSRLTQRHSPPTPWRALFSSLTAHTVHTLPLHGVPSSHQSPLTQCTPVPRHGVHSSH